MADPEYIVVGSGAGGGPLAARLAELGHRVLLLEAGGQDEPWTYQVPVFHGLATEDDAMRLDYYVRHYADEGRQRNDPKYEPARGGVFYPRARTVGGCTAHYAMIIIRPHDSDWQAIRDATGDPSWAPPEMNPYFARVERCLYRDGPTGGHGQAGWLPTRWPDVLRLAGDAIDHRDLSIGRIALEAATANPVKLPIGLGDAPTLEDLAKAKVDPNDLRVLERHGTGLIVVPLAIAFWGLIVYKVFYDAREGSTETTMELARLEAFKILPAVLLSLLEIAVMSAISVAISTRAPMVVNMVTCLAIFVVGHLTPSLVRAQAPDAPRQAEVFAGWRLRSRDDCSPLRAACAATVCHRR